jgi:hypothetical protein
MTRYLSEEVLQQNLPRLCAPLAILARLRLEANCPGVDYGVKFMRDTEFFSCRRVLINAVNLSYRLLCAEIERLIDNEVSRQLAFEIVDWKGKS